MKLLNLLIIVFVMGCTWTPRELSYKEYRSWMKAPENGLTKVKRVSGVQLTITYLPPAYLAYREFSADESQRVNYDSLMKNYQCSLAFQIELQADHANKSYGNLMIYRTTSQEELTERTQFLSFRVHEFVSAKSDDKTFAPVISNFEGYNPLANNLSFQVVFQIPDFNCGSPSENFNNVQVTWDDPYWDLGTNHFEFEKKILVELPKLDF